MKVKDALQRLREWRACSEGFDRVKGKRSIKSMIEAASPSDLMWAIEKIGVPALAEYGRVRVPALAEYDRVRGAALAEYNRVRVAALAEYNRVCEPASAEYGRVCMTAARSILLKKYG